MRPHVSVSVLALCIGSLILAPAARCDADVRTVDASKENVPLQSLATAGARTLVMIASPGCPDCRAAKPDVVRLPQQVKGLSVVIADIGTSPKKINWKAPLIVSNGIRGLPAYFIFDPAGKVEAKGEKAADQVAEWVSSLPKTK